MSNTRGYRSKLKPHHYLGVFQLARQGLSKEKMAKELKVTKQSLVNWLKTDPEILKAFRAGREEFKSTNFSEYIYKHLPPHLRDLWEEIKDLSDEQDAARLTKKLEDAHLKKRDRQYLFVHCLVTCHFNPLEACRRTGTSYTSWEKWKKEQSFHQLVKQIYDMKKDFVEGALMGLISQGDSAATIFANKTLNADRGFNPTKKVEVSGTVTHGHLTGDQVLDMLDMESKKKILHKIRQLNEGKKQPKMLSPHIAEDEKMLIEDAQYDVKEEVDEDVEA